MQAEEEKGNVEFLCRCSYVEIYNEAIYDLLDPCTPVCKECRQKRRKGTWSFFAVVRM
jgi:hypothetical protein